MPIIPSMVAPRPQPLPAGGSGGIAQGLMHGGGAVVGGGFQGLGATVAGPQPMPRAALPMANPQQPMLRNAQVRTPGEMAMQNGFQHYENR